MPTCAAATAPKGDDILAEIVKRTAKVSGAFIKELMRRSVQFHLEHPENAQQSGTLHLPDVQEALEEMMFHGGALNAKLLGGAVPELPIAGR